MSTSMRTGFGAIAALALGTAAIVGMTAPVSGQAAKPATRLHATAWYDNSTANKSNPDPTKDVWWGDQQ